MEAFPLNKVSKAVCHSDILKSCDTILVGSTCKIIRRADNDGTNVNMFRLVYLAISNQILTRSPSIENLSSMNRVQRDAFKDNVVQIVVNMKCVSVQSDKDLLCALQ